jgi:AraC-like DNA-binding protein
VFGTIRLSTDDLPERDRVGIWREVIGRTIFGLDFAPLPDQPLRTEFVAGALPGLSFVSEFSTGMRVERTPELVVADNGGDDVLLGLSLTGISIAHARGREVTIDERSSVLLSRADTGLVIHPGHSRLMGFAVSRALLAPLVPGLDDAVMRPIARNTEPMRLLAGYGDLLAGITLADAAVRHVAVTHVHDLIALAIGASRDAAAIAEGRGLRAARLKAVKADIAERLGNGDLTVAEVASRHRVSPRYVQMLFEGEGTTFSQYVLNQRLARAHRLLTDPRAAGLSITAIAFEAGFSDLSHFNRAFRRLYGASPSGVRAAGHGNGQG